MRQAGITILLLLDVLLFFFVTVPLLFFALLGFQGGLTDTSLPENRTAGLFFLVYALPPLALNVAGVLGVYLMTKDRGRPDVCSACGYDLRSIPSARCPECGAGRSRSPDEANKTNRGA